VVSVLNILEVWDSWSHLKLSKANGVKTRHASNCVAGFKTEQSMLAALSLSILLARDSMLSALYAIASPSVCLSVTRVDQSKTVEVRIMQFSPYSSPIPLVSTVGL